MIEDLDYKLTGSPKETLNTDNFAVAEKENVDEAITEDSKARNEMENDLKDEQNTKSYVENMNIDIENINIIENRINVHTKQWRIIHEAIQKETDIFLDGFLKRSVFTT